MRPFAVTRRSHHHKTFSRARFNQARPIPKRACLFLPVYRPYSLVDPNRNLSIHATMSASR
jgi:hypothetical protein